MTLTSALGIATGGLANIDRQLSLLVHNVSNASTQGYVRQVAVQTAVTADGVGMGVRSGPVVRDLDAPLQAEVWSASARLADAQTRQTALAAIDSAQGTPGSGYDLASRLSAMQSAFSQLATNPADATQQQSVVSAAQSLAQTVNDLSTTYTNQRQQAQDDARASIDTLNKSLAEIGSLSDQIIRLKAMGESTADLENARDSAVSQVSSLIDVKAFAQPNGDMLLVSSNGLSLPTRGGAAPFSLADASAQPGASYPGGGLGGIMLGGVDVTASFTTGRIAADISLRDNVLPTAQAALDEFSATLSQRMQAQGLSLFTDPAGNVPAGGGTPAQAGYVGYAAIMQVNPAITSDPSLVRDGTQAVAASPTGASAFTPNTGGAVAGFNTLIQRVLDYALGSDAQQGVPQPTASTTGLGPSGTLSLSYTAPATLGGFASQIVGIQASMASDARNNADVVRSVQTALQSRLDTNSGVNIDTEMSQMVQLQNAYAANAHVVSAVQTMWDQLLGVVK